jgi:hypothetical protein
MANASLSRVLLCVRQKWAVISREAHAGRPERKSESLCSHHTHAAGGMDQHNLQHPLSDVLWCLQGSLPLRVALSGPSARTQSLMSPRPPSSCVSPTMRKATRVSKQPTAVAPTMNNSKVEHQTTSCYCHQIQHRTIRPQAQQGSSINHNQGPSKVAPYRDHSNQHLMGLPQPQVMVLPQLMVQLYNPHVYFTTWTRTAWVLRRRRWQGL